MDGVGAGFWKTLSQLANNALPKVPMTATMAIITAFLEF
jgi:hypothetical protein